MTDKIVVLCTCASPEDGESLGRALVEAGHAACVSVVPAALSIYRWKGEIQSARESLLLIKSSRARFDALRGAIESMHSYEVPEVLALPVVDGAPNYLAWLATCLPGGDAA
ncbi:MAG: divalent-cation tolerance protein CutA [Acidobacteria bacterium]|nr:divalent-cation tolerance protein CutA [Acidobacteriota bacterium]